MFGGVGGGEDFAAYTEEVGREAVVIGWGGMSRKTVGWYSKKREFGEGLTKASNILAKGNCASQGRTR